jgi:hypothetical protein
MQRIAELPESEVYMIWAKLGILSFARNDDVVGLCQNDDCGGAAGRTLL